MAARVHPEPEPLRSLVLLPSCSVTDAVVMHESFTFLDRGGLVTVFRILKLNWEKQPRPVVQSEQMTTKCVYFNHQTPCFGQQSNGIVLPQ